MTGLYPTDIPTLAALSEEQWDELLASLQNAHVPAPRKLIVLVAGRDYGSVRERVLYDVAQGMRTGDIARKHEIDSSYVSLIKHGRR